jgi:hypothetical protein
MTQEIRKLETSPRWRRVFSSDGVMVFTRRHVASATVTP